MKQTQNTKYYLAASIALITFLVYISTIKNEFVNWDDATYIYENPYISSFNIDFLKWAFFDFYAANWHPLTWISHAIDYAVWGLNPVGHHLSNNILHAVNTFLVVLLMVRLLATWQAGKPESPYSPRFTLIVAGVTGLLFGIHPIHVESVAWASERKDLLCALFFLMSIIAYTKYITPPVRPSDKAERDEGSKGINGKWYFISLGFFITALLSKPMAVTLPLILLIIDWYPFERIRSFQEFRAAFIEKLPFIGLSLASSILTILAQRSGGAIKSMVYAPLTSRVLIGIKSLISYLWNTILPVNLIPFYPYPKDISLASLEYVSAISLVCGITIACIVIAGRNKLWLAVWSYYILNLLPVLGIVQVGDQAMADRYMYLPSLGLFVIIGSIAAWVWNGVNRSERRNLIAKFLAAASILIFVSLSYLTVKQISIWKNSIVFWDYIIEKEPERVVFAYLNRGMAFEKSGEQHKAIEDYNKAINIDPLYFEAYNNLGVLYGQDGSFGKALEYLNRAIGIDPTFVDAYVNRGIAYALSGQYDSALKDFNEAILLNRNSAEAYFNRGSLYLKAGNIERAVSDFQKACNLGKQDACARTALY